MRIERLYVNHDKIIIKGINIITLFSQSDVNLFFLCDSSLPFQPPHPSLVRDTHARRVIRHLGWDRKQAGGVDFDIIRTEQLTIFVRKRTTHKSLISKKKPPH